MNRAELLQKYRGLCIGSNGRQYRSPISRGIGEAARVGLDVARDAAWTGLHEAAANPREAFHPDTRGAFARRHLQTAARRRVFGT